jgi:hypothetical protein
MVKRKKKKMFYLELMNMIYVGMLGISYQILNRYQIQDHKVDPESKRYSIEREFQINSIT